MFKISKTKNKKLTIPNQSGMYFFFARTVIIQIMFIKKLSITAINPSVTIVLVKT